MIKHVVFDFGGVILDLDGVHTGYPDNLADIFQIQLSEAQNIWDANKTSVITGKETPQEFLIRMKDEYGFTFDVKNGLQYWEEKNHIDQNRIDWQLVEAISELKANYQVHLFTDQIQLKNGATAWIDRINTNFHTILRSYEQGYRKPFPESYQNLLGKVHATNEPETVVFIDDSSINIDAARNAQMYGVLYTFRNHILLKKALDKLGVMIAL